MRSDSHRGRVRPSAAAILVTASVLFARTAAAEGPTDGFTRGPSRRAEGCTWYGWQTLAADAVAAGVLALAIPTRERAQAALTAGGVGAYALGVPVVHAMHGRTTTASGSVVLRVALAFAGMGVGRQLQAACPKLDDGTPDCPDTPPREVIVGAAVGAALAAATDAIVLTWEPSGDDTTAAERAQQARPLVTPSVALVPGGLQLGITGSL